MTQHHNQENLLGSGFVKQVLDDGNGNGVPVIQIMVSQSSNSKLLHVGRVYTVKTATVNDGIERMTDLQEQQLVYFRAKEDVSRDPSVPGSERAVLICYIWTYPKPEYFGDNTDYAIVRREEKTLYQCWAVFRRNIVVPKRITQQQNLDVLPGTRLKLTYNPFPMECLAEVSLFQKDDCQDIYCDDGMITRYNDSKGDGFIVGRALGSIFLYEAALSTELQKNRKSLEGKYVSVVAVFDKKASGDRLCAHFKAFLVHKLGDEPPLEYYARCNFRIPLAEKFPSEYVGKGIVVGLIGETAELAFRYGRVAFTTSLIAGLKDESGLPLIPSSAPLSTLIGSILWFKAKAKTRSKTETEWSCTGIGLRKEDVIS